MGGGGDHGIGKEGKFGCQFFTDKSKAFTHLSSFSALESFFPAVLELRSAITSFATAPSLLKAILPGSEGGIRRA